jgi:Cu/Ag efflux protein CusF
MLKLWGNTTLNGLAAWLAFSACCAVALPAAQQPAPAGAKPPEHVIGTVTAVDSASHAVTVKEDKTGAEQKILVGNTRTLLKVEPGAKDLKSATRIQADDLQVGDRVDVRGSRAQDEPNVIAARSVVLMSARDLEKAHRAQAEAWQHSTAGTVSSVDPASGKLNITVRMPSGVQPATVTTSRTTEFTRYSLENPKTPVASELAQIQPGDQVRIIGSKNEDGSVITAERIYSEAFRTINGTLTTIAADGKSIVVKDLASKKPIEIGVTDQSEIRKLPSTMAMMLARRFNPNFRRAEAASGTSNEETGGNGNEASPSAARPPEARGETASQSMRTRSRADIPQMIEHLPPISVSDLKPGDALVISGVVAGSGSSRLLATSIIAGVEPILQSAPARSGGQAMGGDWGLGEMTIPQ